jgi:hypothetical protein
MIKEGVAQKWSNSTDWVFGWDSFCSSNVKLSRVTTRFCKTKCFIISLRLSYISKDRNTSNIVFARSN